MAKAKQLPSGAWRVQVYNKGGDPKYVSFTADTEDEANFRALEWKLSRERKARIGLTVGEAIDQYIELKDGVLSPTTIANYRVIRRNNIQSLMDVPVKSLTQVMVQQAINEEAKTISPRTHKRHTPKTIANVHGLLSAAIRSVDPDFVLRTTLPAKQKQIIELPPAKDVDRRRARHGRRTAGSAGRLAVVLHVGDPRHPGQRHQGRVRYRSGVRRPGRRPRGLQESDEGVRTHAPPRAAAVYHGFDRTDQGLEGGQGLH
jgi:hypothetical protein